MTQRPSRQPDHAHDESARPSPSIPAGTLDEEHRDERIDAAIQRLFLPPTVWPPLFGDIDTPEDRVEANSAANEQEADNRASKPDWLRRVGVAAALMMGLVGLWLTWNELAPSPLFRSAQRPATVEVGELYRQLVIDGFAPMHDRDHVARADGRWVIPETPMSIQLRDAEALDMEIELLGTHQCESAEARSPWLMMRIETEPVVLFAGSSRRQYIADGTGSPRLHLHHRRIGSFIVYELTPHDSPAVLRFVECEEVGCEPPGYPKCAIEVTP